MASSDWSSPDDLADQVLRKWNSGQLLRARVTGESLFPLALRLKRPTRRELGERFDEVRRWIRALEDGSRARRGFGYDITFDETDHRQLGWNRCPARASVPTEDDALRLLNRTRAAAKFQSLAGEIVTAFPALRTWILTKPLKVLEFEERWSRLLAVLAWFRDHPHSGLYLRQLDIEGVDTKFVEDERLMLTELLDVVAPWADAGGRGRVAFEQRVGLRSKPTMIRFRLLDDAQRMSGFTDLTVPAAELARVDVPVDDVFITENEVNLLAFPMRRRSLVVFGQGYAVERVSAVPWLAHRRVFYWGDIDTHGFAALDRVRQHVPSAMSLLMDRETLLAHRSMWVEEREQQAGPLIRLNEAERDLFRELRNDTYGPRVRLEQERISFASLASALARIGEAPI